MKQKNEQITSKITYYRFLRPTMVNGIATFLEDGILEFPLSEGTFSKLDV